MTETPTLRCPSCGAPAEERERSCAHCRSLLSTRRCVGCFTLNPREASRCGRCGAELPHEELSVSAAGQPCPECRVPLVARKTGVVGYTECARCGGLFLSREAFESVTRGAEGRAAARTIEGSAAPDPEKVPSRFRYRKCPSCGQLMNRTNYGSGSGIIVDVCRAHGVFLDRGELTAVVAFLEGGGWERVKKRERERLTEEVVALEAKKHAASLGGGLGPPETGGASLVDLISWLGSVLGRRV